MEKHGNVISPTPPSRRETKGGSRAGDAQKAGERLKRTVKREMKDVQQNFSFRLDGRETVNCIMPS